MATFNAEMAKGKDAGGAINKYRFVKLDATTPETVVQCDTEGEKAYGVSLFSVSTLEIARGKGCSVVTDGRMIVEAGEDGIEIGNLISTDNVGRAVVADTGDVILGEVDEATIGGGVTGDHLGVMLYDAVAVSA